jgi:hypothetical protein
MKEKKHMSLQQDSQTPGTGAANGQPVVLSLDAQLEELLDQLGVDFVMHTHHPLTHIEYGASTATTGDGEFNIRNECPDPSPMATPSVKPFTMTSLADLL